MCTDILLQLCSAPCCFLCRCQQCIRAGCGWRENRCTWDSEGVRNVIKHFLMVFKEKSTGLPVMHSVLNQHFPETVIYWLAKRSRSENGSRHLYLLNLFLFFGLQESVCRRSTSQGNLVVSLNVYNFPHSSSDSHPKASSEYHQRNENTEAVYFVFSDSGRGTSPSFPDVCLTTAEITLLWEVTTSQVWLPSRSTQKWTVPHRSKSFFMLTYQFMKVKMFKNVGLSLWDLWVWFSFLCYNEI